MKNFTLHKSFPVSANRIYDAWMNSEEHTLMTGGAASISNAVHGTFSAWDGYISGTFIELEPGKRILQKWRTTDFSDDHSDSLVEIVLTDKNGECELTLVHTNIPEDGADYERGWDDYYFTPMQEYLENS